MVLPLYTPAGDLRQQINLLDPQLGGRNPDGGSTAPGVFAQGIWAKIQTLSGRELYKAQQISDDVTHMVIIRYMPGVAERMLVQFGARTFLVQAVEDPYERQAELHLLCVERNQNG